MRLSRARWDTTRQQQCICRRRMPGWNASDQRVAPGNTMKISTFRSQILHVPEDEPLANAGEKEGATRPIVILTLGTDDGIEGIGVTFYGGALTRTLKNAVDEMAALCVGEDPHRVEAIVQKMRKAAGGSGPRGT